MTILKTTTVALAMLLASPLAAAPYAETVTVKVNGLVCDFCARSIEAMMKKRTDVAGVHVDLDKGEVHLAMKPGATLDDPALKKLIVESGYSVTAIARTPKS